MLTLELNNNFMVGLTKHVHFTTCSLKRTELICSKKLIK